MKNKNLVKSLLSIALIVSLNSITWAQVGYSITDNDQDVTGFEQQLYRINAVNGSTTYLGDLTLDRNGDGVINETTGSATGERLQREYEGLASIGGVLYGVPEFADLSGIGVVCNTGQDPIAGLSVDLRTFRYTASNRQTVPTPGNRLPAVVPFPLVPGTPGSATVTGGTDVNKLTQSGVVGPQIGEVCIGFGTESALGYNAIDGYLYSIASNDLISLPNVRSQLNRIDPTNGRVVAVFNMTNPNCPAGCTPTSTSGDPVPYLDGMTILPNGTAYGSEVRFSVDPNAGDADNLDAGGLYLIDLTNGNTTLVKHLLPATLGRDTGLANNASGSTLYILNERGLIYQTTPDPATPVLGNDPTGVSSPVRAMFTTGATSGARGGASPAFPTGRSIEGCRGVQGGDEFDQVSPVAQSCGDFEGFDIPLSVLQ